MNRARAGIRPSAWLSGVLLAASGCAHEKSAVSESGPQDATQKTATTTAHDVTLTARGDAWSGDPENLETQVVPVYVAIENRSDQNLAVRYGAITLQDSDGGVVQARPPFRIEGAVYEPTEADRKIEELSPDFEYYRFHVRPNFEPRYTGVSYWKEPIAWDDATNATQYMRWEQPLPTMEMIKKALPEGVLEPGGRVAGFVYFDAEELKGGEQATMRLELQGPEGDDEQLGELSVDLVPRRDNV